jgi:hypothetical protein
MGIDTSGMFSVDPQAGVGGNSYGDPGAAAWRGMQSEVLRRQQMQMAQDALVRQQQQDELDKQVKLETLAGLTETRKASAAKSAADALKLQQDELTKTLKPGDTRPATIAALKFAQLPQLVNAVAPPTDAAAPAPPASLAADPGAGVAPENPDTSEAPLTTTPLLPKETYTGTDAQQSEDERKQYAKDTLGHKYDTGDINVDRDNHLRALDYLMTGKESTRPAALLNGPKSAVEGTAADNLALEKIYYDQRIAKGETPNAAKLGARADLNHLQGQEAAMRAQFTSGAADNRQDNSLTATAKQGVRSAISADFAKLLPDMERVQKAETVLNSPNWLNDVLAVPSVLQIMAGGMGSGLRMTSVEINNVNQAQSKLDQIRGDLSKYGAGPPVSIQADMRKNMKTIIDTVKKARLRQSQDLQDTLEKVATADSPEAVDHIHAQWIKSATDSATGMAPAETKKNLTYNPKTGKVE